MKVLVLSPHRDDAAFSCGLLLRELLRRSAQITIANVCTVSDYAPYAEVAGANNTRRVTELRAEEDRQFARELCAGLSFSAGELKWLDLAWLDAPLRWQIPTDDVLTAQPLREPEVAELADIFSKLTADIVLAPLGLGGHVDHLLTRDAARRAFHSGCVLFYEDLPYASRMSPIEWKLAHTEIDTNLLSAWTLNVPSVPGLKQKFASCYPSQIAADVAYEMDFYAAEFDERERLYGTNEALQAINGVLNNRVAHV